MLCRNHPILPNPRHKIVSGLIIFVSLDSHHATVREDRIIRPDTLSTLSDMTPLSDTIPRLHSMVERETSTIRNLGLGRSRTHGVLTRIRKCTRMEYCQIGWQSRCGASHPLFFENKEEGERVHLDTRGEFGQSLYPWPRPLPKTVPPHLGPEDARVARRPSRCVFAVARAQFPFCAECAGAAHRSSESACSSTREWPQRLVQWCCIPVRVEQGDCGRVHATGDTHRPRPAGNA